MKTRLLQQSRERKIIYFIMGLFALNAFGMIPVWVVGAYTAEPMKITTSVAQEDGIAEKRIDEIPYSEGLASGFQKYIYEFFRYSFPVTMAGYFLVSLPEFSYDYLGVAAWVLSLVSIPVMFRLTAKFPVWKRAMYVYVIAVQIAGMWALPRVNFECIPLIDYPLSAGPPCGI